MNKLITLTLTLTAVPLLQGYAYITQPDNSSANAFLEIETSDVGQDPRIIAPGTLGTCTGGNVNNPVRIGCSPYIIRPKTTYSGWQGFVIPVAPVQGFAPAFNPQAAAIKATAYRVQSNGEYAHSTVLIQSFGGALVLIDNNNFNAPRLVPVSTTERDTQFILRLEADGATFTVQEIK